MDKLNPTRAQDMYNHPANYAYIPWCDVNQGVVMSADVDANGNHIIDSLEVATPAPKAAVVVTAAPKATVVVTASPTPFVTPFASPSPSPTASPATASDTHLAGVSTKNSPLLWALGVIAIIILATIAGYSYWMKRKKIRR